MSHILDESLALIEEEGIENLGIRRLARRLGCSTSTLYRQLPGGKDELHIRLADHVSRTVTRDVLETINREHLTDWIAIVERSALAGFDHMRAHPHVASLFANRPVRLSGDRYKRVIPVMITAGVSPEDARSAEHAIARMTVAYALQDLEHLEMVGEEAADGTFSPDSVRQVPLDPDHLRSEFQFAIRTFLEGLRQLADQTRPEPQ